MLFSKPSLATVPIVNTFISPPTLYYCALRGGGIGIGWPGGRVGRVDPRHGPAVRPQGEDLRPGAGSPHTSVLTKHIGNETHASPPALLLPPTNFLKVLFVWICLRSCDQVCKCSLNYAIRIQLLLFYVCCIYFYIYLYFYI